MLLRESSSSRGKSIDMMNRSLPGPGSYSPSHGNLEKSPSFRIGTARRFGQSAKHSMPGPGRYNPENSKSKGNNTV